MTEERLRKIRELALRGCGGERDTAAALLDKLMKKHGITEQDLDREELQSFVFEFHGAHSKKLLLQIAYKVTGYRDRVYSRRYVESGRKCLTEVSIHCTEAQRAEIAFLHDFYLQLWEKEVEFFLSAFIQKHELFGTLKEGESGGEWSAEELRRFYALQHGMQDESPLLRLEGGAK